MEEYNYIVVGLGCSGLMSLEKLSRSNKVLGIDKHGIKNKFGSSHGESRIYRLSYYEGEEYLPLLKKSYQKWKNLEEKTGTKLMEETGFLFISDNSGNDKIEACRKSCVKANIEYKEMNSREINRSHTNLNVREGVEGIYHRKGGVLKSGDILSTVENICRKRKNCKIMEEEMKNLNIKENKVKVECTDEEYQCEKVIMCTGPWIIENFEKMKNLLQVEKHFYCNYVGEIDMDSCLISYVDDKHFYGLPDVGKYDIKIGKLGEDKVVNKMENFYDSDSTQVDAEDNREFVKNYFDSSFSEISYSSCPITRTPDNDYIIDFHPNHDNVILCCGMSGHGFKLSNYNAEIVSDLAQEGYNKHSEEIFSVKRLM